MKLHGISLSHVEGSVRLSGEIERTDGRRLETYFQFPERYGHFVSETADPLAAAMLAPAMEANEPLTIVPPISPQLLLSLHRLRDMLSVWFPEFHRIDINATAREAETPRAPRHAATFFSGGVDSFYSMLKYQTGEWLPAPMTHLIFMRGVETRLEYINGFEDSQRLTEAVARQAGLECIVGETNIRTSSRLNWERRYVGSGLAATALALAGGLDFVCVPSSSSYRDVTPRGSSPLIDERYSTELLRILFDGGEVSRAMKVERIVSWDRQTVLASLRVCIENQGGSYNCGECRKCVRTAIALAAVGAWKDVTNFRNKSTDHWETLARSDHPHLVRENQELARTMDTNPALIKMLDRVVRSHRRREAVRTLVQESPAAALLPLIRQARRRLR